MSYGPDFVDEHRQAASYVDRILKGDKPGDLPVQTPTNSSSSSISRPPKRFGISIPLPLLGRADEVIE